MRAAAPFASPCVEGVAFDTSEGGGRNATGLARPSQRSVQLPTGELSPMAFLGGGVCRMRGRSPPPDASSDLDRPLRALTGRRWPIQAADASPSPLVVSKASLRHRGRHDAASIEAAS